MKNKNIKSLEIGTFWPSLRDALKDKKKKKKKIKIGSINYLKYTIFRNFDSLYIPFQKIIWPNNNH